MNTKQGKLVHKTLALHFLAQLSLVEDAASRVAAKGIGRVHHRILFFAHFTPGIRVGELLGVLGVKPQNIQVPLAHLIQKGYVLARSSSEDHRVRRLYSSPKGDKLLEYLSAAQHARITAAFKKVSADDVKSYHRVMTALVDAERAGWVRQLTEGDTTSRLHK